MTRDELFARLLEGTTKRWHWWGFHFQTVARGRQVPFVDALLDGLLQIDAVMPGYAARMAGSIVALGGREDHRPDYEQLLQLLAEFHVALQIVRGAWPAGTTFADEPVAPASKRNPELVVEAPEFRVGVEVKAPALLDHELKRSSRGLQAGGRGFTPEQLARIAGSSDDVTLPRDNPVKDFLVSANEKFAAFSEADPDFYGLLAVVWDDFIYEPITALLHPASGLFTEESFARSGTGAVLEFEHVDGVLLISHQQYLKWALAEDGDQRPFEMGHQAFDWTIDVARPVAYLDTPHGRRLPDAAREPLQTRPLGEIPGAEYHPSDMVWWINTGDRSDP